MPSAVTPPRALQLELRRQNMFSRTILFRAIEVVEINSIRWTMRDICRRPEDQPSTWPNYRYHSGRKCDGRLVFICIPQRSLHFRPQGYTVARAPGCSRLVYSTAVVRFQVLLWWGVSCWRVHTVVVPDGMRRVWARIAIAGMGIVDHHKPNNTANLGTKYVRYLGYVWK